MVDNSQEMARQKKTEEWPMDWLPEKWVGRIIADLDLAHNGQLVSWLRDEDQAKALRHKWAKELGALTPGQIRIGLQKSATLEKVPTAAQFRRLCLRLPAYRPFPALPKIKSDPERARTAISAARDVLRRKSRRIIITPSYSVDDYVEDCMACRAAGLPRYVADMRAMSRNGWREADEAAYRDRWLCIQGHVLEISQTNANAKNALYGAGHAPPAWVLQATPEQHADVDQWILTGIVPDWVNK